MANLKTLIPGISRRAQFVLGGIALFGVGAAAGAGGVSMTRPAVEMAPTANTAIASLPQTSGIVTVRGRIAEIYGDRFVVQDNSGRTLVDAGPTGGSDLAQGAALMVQGRYENGQLHASFLVDQAGRVSAVGGPRPRGPHERGPHGGPGMPPPPPPGEGAVPPPPPVAGAAPALAPVSATAPTPAPAPAQTNQTQR